MQDKDTEAARELRVLADLLERGGGDADEVSAIAGRVEALARDLRARVRRLDERDGRPGSRVWHGRPWGCRNTLAGKLGGGDR